ncbi:hypothetical protein [uncultured Roseobacter sp.]|uniref:hypothetical protein n=1 Tax=uncultured Roseobacter sp. TaxID=114847 RepID=UPI0026252535|nr:hypothetical protein [uncultured Roseobacter sp.]
MAAAKPLPLADYPPDRMVFLSLFARVAITALPGVAPKARHFLWKTFLPTRGQRYYAESKTAAILAQTLATALRRFDHRLAASIDQKLTAEAHQRLLHRFCRHPMIVARRRFEPPAKALHQHHLKKVSHRLLYDLRPHLPAHHSEDCCAMHLLG